MPNKSNVQASSRLKGWWRFRNETLERVAFIVAIVGFPLLVISTCAVLYQFIEVRHIASSQNYILLSNLFFRDANIAIIDAIEINAIDGKKQILREHGGENTNTRLDNYLGDLIPLTKCTKRGCLPRTRCAGPFLTM